MSCLNNPIRCDIIFERRYILRTETTLLKEANKFGKEMEE